MKRVLSLTFRGNLFAVGSLFLFVPYKCLSYSYISPLQKLPGAEGVGEKNHFAVTAIRRLAAEHREGVGNASTSRTPSR
jgi:hypothetical protein